MTNTTIQQPPKVSHADTTNDVHTALRGYHMRMGERETVPLLVTQLQWFDSFDTTTQTGKPLTFYSMEKNAQQTKDNENNTRDNMHTNTTMHNDGDNRRREDEETAKQYGGQNRRRTPRNTKKESETIQTQQKEPPTTQETQPPCQTPQYNNHQRSVTQTQQMTCTHHWGNTT